MSLRHTLLAILDWVPLHGYALRETAKTLSWLHPMTNANIYPTLRQLEADGFIKHRQEIVEGRLRITRGERVVAEIGPEAFLGEVGLLEGARRTATATTVTPIRVLRLEREDLLHLMEEIPAIAIRVAQELSRRYRQVMEQMVE